jgi:signal transduction histidine kinase
MSTRRRTMLLAAAVLAVSLLAGREDPEVGVLVAGCAGCLVLGLRVASPVRVAAAAAGAIGAMTALNQVVEAGEYALLDDVVFFTLMFGTPAVVGHLLRRRAELIAELSARAATLRAAREEQAAAAVAEERARVAIGVHDALAHRVGEMSLHAAGAIRVAGDDPDRALSALARIEDAGRAALDDIREVIGVLRADDPLALAPLDTPDTPIPSAWSPRPGAPAAPPPRRASDDRLDVAIAVAVFVAITVEALTSSRAEGPAVLNVLGVAAIAAPLAFRRRAPLAAVTATCAACVVQSLWLTSPGVLVTPIVLLLLPPYSVAAYLPLRPALAGLAVCLAASFALEPSPATGILGLAAFAAGRVVRDRSRRAAELDAVTTELERTRDAHAARMRGEERLRIARELHDAVAHSMTVVVLQAGAAQRVWGRDPAAARVAIEALTGVARATLAELRATLRDTAPTDTPALDELAARMRPLGLDVVLRHEPLPAGVERVVTAVVQEALTNAARYAAPTTVRVDVQRAGDDALVTVVDDGRSGPAAPGARIAGTGTGLRGLAERVAAAGGELRHGPAGRGFRVEARLPVAREAAVA